MRSMGCSSDAKIWHRVIIKKAVSIGQPLLILIPDSAFVIRAVIAENSFRNVFLILNYGNNHITDSADL